MSRTPYAGPKLPQTLLDRVHGSNGSMKHGRKEVSRKDKRKAERQDKKTAHAQARTKRPHEHNAHQGNTSRHVAVESNDKTFRPRSNQTGNTITARHEPLPKSILKKPAVRPDTSSSENEDFDSESGTPLQQTVVSRSAKRRLDEDDAEIAALEKKLGIKGKKSKALEEEGLDWLANGSDSDIGAENPRPTKRKRVEDDRWLESKRQKAARNTVSGTAASNDDKPFDDDSSDEVDGLENPFSEDEVDSDMEELANPFSEDELSNDSFGFDDHEDKDSEPNQRRRENPYVAPVSKDIPAAKYIPPSLRRAQGQDVDLTQLKRQIQGQLNRLSEANFILILSTLEDIYSKNARQHVTAILIELFMGLVSSASTLSETFLILHSAFAAAIYKVIGLDFGTQLLESVTTAITNLRTDGQGKQVLNLLGFLSNLYIMQLVGATIIFDYIRGLLEELSEDNTELLLRVIRTAGIQLRHDNPTALKDIVLLLTRSVSRVGETNLSVRTKFMIETINDLKNNKMKTGANATAVTSEHVLRMRKTLGSLNSRSLRSSEPLQVSLADLQDSEKKGKWWLVGASYNDPLKHAQHESSASITKGNNIDDGYESETPGHVSLPKLARAQGMNTDIRRAIFIAIMSAADFQDAHLRILKLHLKNKQLLEVTKVLLQCAGAEAVHNPYYTIISRKLCSEPKLQKAFQSSLWDVLRKLNSNDDEGEQMSTTTVMNIARLFGTLMAEDQVSITSLKTLEWAIMPANAQAFAEVLLTTVMIRLHKTKALESSTSAIFAQAASAPRMLSGLQLFLRDVVSKAEMTNTSKERKAVERGCELALEALQGAASGVVMSDDDDLTASESDSD